MAEINAAERGEATASLPTDQASEGVGDPSIEIDADLASPSKSIIGWDGLVSVMEDDRRYNYFRTFRPETSRLLLFQQDEIERLERKRQKLSAAALSRVGQEKPKRRYRRRERDVMKKMGKQLANHFALLVHYSAVLDLDRPVEQNIKNFQRCKKDAFRDGSEFWSSVDEEDFGIPGPKPTQLRRAVRRLPQTALWRSVFGPARASTRVMKGYNVDVYPTIPFDFLEAGSVVSVVAVFVLAPIVLVALKVLSSVGVILFFTILVVVVCILSWIVGGGVEVFAILILAYASIVCNLLQIATQTA